MTVNVSETKNWKPKMSRQVHAEPRAPAKRPLKVQPEVPPFRAIGIAAVAAAAMARRSQPRRQEAVKELPPLLRKDKFED